MRWKLIISEDNEFVGLFNEGLANDQRSMTVKIVRIVIFCQSLEKIATNRNTKAYEKNSLTLFIPSGKLQA